MFNPRPSTAIARTCWGLVLGLVLAIRLTVPAGTMPAWSAGGLAMVACDDAVAASGHRGNAGHGDKDKGSKKQPCPYAIAAGMAADQPASAWQELRRLPEPALQQSRPVSIGHGLAAPPPPPTGPPLA